MSLTQELEFAIETARTAAALVLKHYGNVRRLTKRHNEAVSDADRESQRLIIAAINKKYPADGIVGEENETGDAITFNVSNPAGRNWVIDPIDGTNNFLAGLGNFAVCIGLLDAGQPVLGVVYDVTRGQMYAAARGSGAWLDKVRIKPLGSALNDASLLMLTSSLVGPDGKMPSFPTRWLTETNWKVRILGSAALEAVQVAAGVAHGAITINGKLWDIAAPAAIVLESGALITTLQGQPIFPFDLRGYTGGKVPFLAAAPAAQAELLREIGS